ncbi:MAG: hypothetical protein D6746_16050 [Bacteroidetes bacterium]|nr:MAG: hypothetical protein D6746_16050 [Bacteroidota bacterium]
MSIELASGLWLVTYEIWKTMFWRPEDVDDGMYRQYVGRVVELYDGDEVCCVHELWVISHHPFEMRDGEGDPVAEFAFDGKLFRVYQEDSHEG